MQGKRSYSSEDTEDFFSTCLRIKSLVVIQSTGILLNYNKAFNFHCFPGSWPRALSSATWTTTHLSGPPVLPPDLCIKSRIRPVWCSACPSLLTLLLHSLHWLPVAAHIWFQTVMLTYRADQPTNPFAYSQVFSDLIVCEGLQFVMMLLQLRSESGQ